MQTNVPLWADARGCFRAYGCPPPVFLMGAALRGSPRVPGLASGLALAVRLGTMRTPCSCLSVIYELIRGPQSGRVTPTNYHQSRTALHQGRRS